MYINFLHTTVYYSISQTDHSVYFTRRLIISHYTKYLNNSIQKMFKIYYHKTFRDYIKWRYCLFQITSSWRHPCLYMSVRSTKMKIVVRFEIFTVVTSNIISIWGMTPPCQTTRSNILEDSARGTSYLLVRPTVLRDFLLFLQLYHDLYI
jgi:hypothetical protein